LPVVLKEAFSRFPSGGSPNPLEPPFCCVQKTPPQGKNSANHEFINPLALFAVYAPAWDLPATFLYCCPITVLEWNSGHDFVLPPATKLESPVSHRSYPPTGY